MGSLPMSSRFIALFGCIALLSCAVQGQSGPEDRDEEDGLGWPQEIMAGETRIMLYQPPLESLKGDRMGARMAVSVTPPGAPQPTSGSVWIHARLPTDRDRRTATPVEVTVTETRFPSTEEGTLEDIRRTIATELPHWRLTFSMD